LEIDPKYFPSIDPHFSHQIKPLIKQHWGHSQSLFLVLPLLTEFEFSPYPHSPKESKRHPQKYISWFPEPVDEPELESESEEEGRGQDGRFLQPSGDQLPQKRKIRKHQKVPTGSHNQQEAKPSPNLPI
jgi:hypothetical protein